jgi:1,4-alpha-glucan branching enzyme
VVVLNLTPVLRQSYRLGLPCGGFWTEVLNTDAEIYGGDNQGNAGGVKAESEPAHQQPFSAGLTLPPLGVVVLGSEGL